MERIDWPGLNKYLYCIYKIICRIYNIIIKHTFQVDAARVRIIFFCSSPRALRNQNKWLFSQQVIALHLTFCGFHAECAAFGFQFETCTTVKSFENAWIKKNAKNDAQLMQIRGVSFWIANRLSNKFLKEGRIENINSINFRSCSTKCDAMHCLSFRKIDCLSAKKLDHSSFETVKSKTSGTLQSVTWIHLERINSIEFWVPSSSTIQWTIKVRAKNPHLLRRILHDNGKIKIVYEWRKEKAN